MKRALIFPVIMLVAVAVFAAEPAGTIIKVIGTVEVFPTAGTGWKTAGSGTKVYAKDQVRTSSASSAEIRWANGGTLRIAEKSAMTVKELTEKAVAPDVKMLSGKVWANMKKITNSGNKFSVESPTAVAGIRGTVFRLDVGADTATDVLVYEGKVAVGPGADLQKGDSAKSDTSARHEVQGPSEVEGPKEVTLKEWVTIVAGQQIRVEHSGAFRKWQFDQKQDSVDAWVRFNLERDAAMEKK
jgi:hypothetical protein